MNDCGDHRSARKRTRSELGFTLVELLIVTTILGLLSAVAIPAVTAYFRRVKTSEARIQIAKMFDSTAAYYNGEHVERGDVSTIATGAAIAVGATHRCPHPSAAPAGGQAGLTPSIDCNAGPGSRCVPSGAPSGAGYYDIREWTDNDVWNTMHFGQEQAHFYRYNFSASNTLSGYGTCNFTAGAYGNLDADATYSTFERTGGADINGVNANGGLYIDGVIE
jgi:type IV pilus assembly protein PilA